MTDLALALISAKAATDIATTPEDLGGGFFVFASFLYIISLVIGVFNIWMLIDSIIRSDEDYRRLETSKVMWILLVLFVPLASFFYFFMVKRKAGSVREEYESHFPQTTAMHSVGQDQSQPPTTSPTSPTPPPVPPVDTISAQQSSAPKKDLGTQPQATEEVSFTELQTPEAAKPEPQESPSSPSQVETASLSEETNKPTAGVDLSGVEQQEEIDRNATGEGPTELSDKSQKDSSISLDINQDITTSPPKESKDTMAEPQAAPQQEESLPQTSESPSPGQTPDSQTSVEPPKTDQLSSSPDTSGSSPGATPTGLDSSSEIEIIPGSPDPEENLGGAGKQKENLPSQGNQETFPSSGSQKTSGPDTPSSPTTS